MNSKRELTRLPQDSGLRHELSAHSLSPHELRDRVNLIQHVMQAVMKKDVHFGVVPGTQKPSLLKAGSEVLLATFQIAVKPRVEDLSSGDCIRYRVFCEGVHAPSGMVVGEGVGECSSDEEKYRWRQAQRREFDAAPEARRRVKFKWNRQERREYEELQVRVNPADVANTVLKMAKKRAQIDMTLTATAASDIFTQDVEELPPELQGVNDEAPPSAPQRQAQQPQARSSKPAASKPAQASQEPAQAAQAPADAKAPAAAPAATAAAPESQGDPGMHVSESQQRILAARADAAGLDIAGVLAHWKRVDPGNLNEVLSWLRDKAEG